MIRIALLPVLWESQSNSLEIGQSGFSLGKGSIEKRGKYGILPYPHPQPWYGLFLGKKLPPFFLSEIKPLMGETNFTLGPTSKNPL